MRGRWSLDGGQLFGVNYVRQSPESGMAKLRASMSVEEFDAGTVLSFAEMANGDLLPALVRRIAAAHGKHKLEDLLRETRDRLGLGRAIEWLHRGGHERLHSRQH